MYNLTIFFIIVSFVLLTLGITKLTIKNKEHKWLTYIFIAGFTLYSGIGLAIHEVEQSILYILQYIGFLSVFIFIAIISSKIKYSESNTFNKRINFLVNNNTLLIKIFAIIYIGTYLFPFIYPTLEISTLLDVKALFSKYAINPFGLRIAKSNDFLYRLVTTQIRIVVMPFFFIYLYNNREKPLKFITLFVIPFYLKAISFGYISRNEIAIVIVFIFIYLLREKKLNKITATIFSIIVFPYLLYAFGSFFYIRMGVNVNIDNFWYIILDLIKKESGFVKNYGYASSISGDVNIINYLLYIITLPFPSNITNFLGIKDIVMSQMLTHEAIGLSYGDSNYYLILPSVLGEGIIVFNTFFAWMYSLFFGIFVFSVLRILKSNKYLSYLLLWYFVDFSRQLRGGSQFIISSWINTLIPFYVMILFFTAFNYRRKVNIYPNSHRNKVER